MAAKNVLTFLFFRMKFPITICCCLLTVCITVTKAQYPFQTIYPGGFQYPMQFQRGFSGSGFGRSRGGSIGSQDFFGGTGGRNGLPIWGGAGIGERHADGIDRNGRGWYPFPNH
jgi:hypothetical protein